MSSPGDRARFYYVLAKLYAKSGITDRSLQYLRRAMEEGYKGIEDDYKDAEFAGLRKDPRFSELMAARPSFGAWIHELHHAVKRDAPSGTALLLQAALRSHGFDRPIDVASTRAGEIPGTHTIGFDGGGETITLTHSARDRSPFARGALEAARWVQGRKGWYSMKDVLGL